ncbi:MAG: hypothetical protein EZS28_056470, partial [Streblomastix strix]
TTELAKLGIPERDLATFTHHSLSQHYHSMRFSPPSASFPRELKNRTSRMMLMVG